MSNASNPQLESSAESLRNGGHATTASTHDYFADTSDFAIRGMNFKVVGGTSTTVHASALQTIPSQAFEANQPKTMSVFSRAKGFVLEGGDLQVVGGNSIEIMASNPDTSAPPIMAKKEPQKVEATVTGPTMEKGIQGEAMPMSDIARKTKAKSNSGRSVHNQPPKAVQEAKKRAKKRSRRGKKTST